MSDECQYVVETTELCSDQLTKFQSVTKPLVTKALFSLVTKPKPMGIALHWIGILHSPLVRESPREVLMSKNIFILI